MRRIKSQREQGVAAGGNACRAIVATVLAALVACQPARALVSLNDGHDKIYVNATTAVGFDSNVFANSDDRRSAVYSTSVSAEYTRRAGWIGVNANAAVNSSKFGSIDGQDFINPTFGLELTKQTGRTTGSITASASRESRADADANTRSTYWNIPLGFNFKYPIVNTYTLAGSLGYSSRRYENEFVFASLESYSAALDLFHTMTQERDVLLGYRYRYSETSRASNAIDHGFSLGLAGKLIRGVSGNLRVGYQTRILQTVFGRQQSFGSWTASGTANYAINKKMNLSGTIAKDFATTATDASVDSTTVTIDTQYAHNSHWSVAGSASYGDNAFLGEGGRVVLLVGPPRVLGPQRHDDFLTASATLNYSHNEHFKASLSYSWFKNWSTLSYADFVRSSITLTFSTRW